MFELSQPDQFKHATQASFDATSPSYGTDNDFHWQFAARLLNHAPIVPGQTLLDVATGTAPAARLAAQRLGPCDSVIAADLSRGILRHAATNIRADARCTISLLCADAEYLPLCSQAVDGVVCSSSIVWLPNALQALHDWHRVLRPNGWLAFSCFGGPARQTVITLLSQLLKPYGQVLPELNAPFNSEEKCRSLLMKAGYHTITVVVGADNPLPRSAEASFDWAWASHRRFTIQLTKEQWKRVRREYIEAFTGFETSQEEWNHDYEQFVVAYKTGSS